MINLIESLNSKILNVKHTASQLYLQRQQVEMQLQQLNINKLQIEQMMISTDGELKVLEELLSELNKPENNNNGE